MRVNVLSIQNTHAYLVAHGIKTVENRSWKTDFRGRLYIHASGEPWGSLDSDIVNDYLCNGHTIRHAEEVVKNFDHDNWQKYADGFTPKKGATDLEIVYYRMHFKSLVHWIKADADDNIPPYMETRAIIGYVDLVDCIPAKESPAYGVDPFAGDVGYHWMFKNAVALEEKIRFIPGKLRIWQFDIPE